MALPIEVGWDFGEIGPFSLQVTDAGGTTTITFTAGRYAHRDLSAVMGTGEYTAFSSAFAAALNADATLSGTFTVTWNEISGFYTVARTTGTFSTGNPSGTVAGRILGRTSAAGAAASFTSQIRAHYSILTACGGISNVHDEYEPAGLVEGDETFGGGRSSVDEAIDLKYHDFTIPLESKAATFAYAASSDAWTFQHLWEHARAIEPIYLDIDGSIQSVHALRPEGAHFDPRREVQDWDDAFNLEFRTYLLGRMS
jgi:hypothetical protein